MTMYAQQYENPSRIVTGTPVLTNDDVVLYCDTSAGAVTINLLDIPDNFWMTTWKLYVVDYSNNASTNNITINAGTGQTINGLASFVISVNSGSVLVQITGNTTFVCNNTSSNVSNLAVLNQGSLITSNATSMNFVGIQASAVGSAVTISLSDSGWVDLEGFSWISSSSPLKPQFRVSGKQIFFRGRAIVPLSSASNGSTLITMTESGIGAYYVNDAYPYVYQGAGGCLLNSNGVLFFNLGNNIFPPAYSSIQLDSSYSTSWIIGARVVATSDANSGVALTSVVNVIIDSSQRLSIQTFKDLESSPYIPNAVNGIGSGGARQLISKVKINEYVVSWQLQANGYTQSSILNTGNIRNWTIPSATNQFLFSTDPGEESEIGGFQVNLDGLSGWIV